MDEFRLADCPACGPAPSRVWMRSAGPARYRRCRVCGTVFASPRLRQGPQLEHLRQVFASGPGEGVLASPRRPALQATAAELQALRPGGRLLDVGCYTGAFFEFFPRPAWELYGVEVSPTAAMKAAGDYDAQVFTGELPAAGYPDAYFDLVTLLDTFSYLADPAAFLAEVHRILKPGGLLGLELPGQKFFLARSRGPLCWLIDRRWTRLDPASSFLHWISLAGLLKLLAAGGFSPCYWQAGISPARAGLAGQASALYGWSAGRLMRRGSYALDWAPKYICVAQR